MESDTCLQQRHILIVEDEFFLAFDLVKKLDSLGAIVVGPAPTIEKACKLVADTAHIDAALLDMNLRDVLVYPVAEILQQRAIPFVFTTGYDRLIVPAEYRAVPRVRKPYDVSEVLEELRGLLS